MGGVAQMYRGMLVRFPTRMIINLTFTLHIGILSKVEVSGAKPVEIKVQISLLEVKLNWFRRQWASSYSTPELDLPPCLCPQLQTFLLLGVEPSWDSSQNEGGRS